MVGSGAALDLEFGVWFALNMVAWSVAALYLSAMLFWLFEVSLAGLRYEEPEPAYGLDRVQARIVTIDAEEVVQRTVDALPPGLDDVYVVAEEALEIDGAEVAVVPEEFECAAIRKGRAMEWARRNIPCDREWVLFLDEDTVVAELDGIPEGDVVQFGERPVYTGSLLTYWCEMFRMGYQVEQRAFPFLNIPLYAWGGALAVRKRLEDRVTWNYETIVEDSAFVWRAARERGGVDFRFVPTAFENQAPPSLRELVMQRRRWFAGTREQNYVLPPDYWVLYGMRNLNWAVSPLVPLFAVAVWLVTPGLLLEEAYRWLSLGLLGFVFLWALNGWRYYGERASVALPMVLLSPVLLVLHSAGALYGLFLPPRSFSTTDKVVMENLRTIAEAGDERDGE